MALGLMRIDQHPGVDGWQFSIDPERVGSSGDDATLLAEKIDPAFDTRIFHHCGECVRVGIAGVELGQIVLRLLDNVLLLFGIARFWMNRPFGAAKVKRTVRSSTFSATPGLPPAMNQVGGAG